MAEPEVPSGTCPFWHKAGDGETNICLARQGDPIVVNARYVSTFCSQAGHVRCSLFLRSAQRGGTEEQSHGRSLAMRTEKNGRREGGATLRLTAPRITAPANHARLHSTTIVVGGTAQPGGGVLLFEGQEQMDRAVADESGHWHVTLVGVTPGEHRFYARCSDGADRLSARSNVRALEVEANEEEEPEPEMAPPLQPKNTGSEGRPRSVEPAAPRAPVRNPSDPAATLRLASLPPVLRPVEPRPSEGPPRTPDVVLPAAASPTETLPELFLPVAVDDEAEQVPGGWEDDRRSAAAPPSAPLPVEEVGRYVAPAPRASKVIPAEPAQRAEPVVDLIPVDRAPHPRVAEVLPLETGAPAGGAAPTDIEEIEGQRCDDGVQLAQPRGEPTGEALRALAAYLRAVEIEAVGGDPADLEGRAAPPADVALPHIALGSDSVGPDEPLVRAPADAAQVVAGGSFSASPVLASTPVAGSSAATPAPFPPAAPSSVPSARRSRISPLPAVIAVLLVATVATVAIVWALEHRARSQAIGARPRGRVVLVGVPTSTPPAAAGSRPAPARGWRFPAVHGPLDESVLLISSTNRTPTRVVVTLSGSHGTETRVMDVPAANAVEMELMPPVATDAISLRASAPVLSQRLLTTHGVVHTAPGQPQVPTVTH